MQQEQNNKNGKNGKNGFLIFVGIGLIFLIICFFGYMVTGDKGIEERFSNAVGLPSESGRDENGFFGFTIEGGKLSFGIILILMLTATVLLYKKYGV